MEHVSVCDAMTQSDTDYESDDGGADCVTAKLIGSMHSDRSEEGMEHGGVADATAQRERDDGGADHGSVGASDLIGAEHSDPSEEAMEHVGVCDAMTQSDTDHESDDGGEDDVTARRIGSEHSDRSEEAMEHAGVADATEQRNDTGAHYVTAKPDAKLPRKHTYERSAAALQHLRCITQSQPSLRSLRSPATLPALCSLRALSAALAI
jgi:hypothetical protein